MFTKITRPIVAWLRQLGVRLIAYINDFLLLAPSKEEPHCTTSIGFLDQQREVHPSTLPRNRILRSGSSVSPPSSSSTPAQTVNAKIQGPTAATQGCLSSDHYRRDLAQFIGTASAAAVVIPPGPLFYRSLQASKHHSQKQEGG